MKPESLPRALHEANRASWNAATVAHNSHKADQAGFFRDGGTTLRDEERALLGDLRGRTLAHLLCNSGQDSISIASELGAIVTGVDISDEAVEFARRLSADSGIPASFDRADVFDWLGQARREQRRYDVVFSSYGVVHWISDLALWAEGIAAILEPGGRFVLVDFHPLERIFDRDLQFVGSYFPSERTEELEDGVIDYITRSPGRVSPIAYERGVEDFENPHRGHTFLWTLGELLTAIGRAGLRIRTVVEYPHSIAMRFRPMDEIPGYRTVPLEGLPRPPLLFAVEAERLDQSR